MNNSYENLNLSKLKPCDQYWSQMKKASKGKICSKCSNIIHDFREKSKAEIAHIHANSEGNICGLYSKNQLMPTDLYKPKHKTSLIKPTLLGILALFLNKEAEAGLAKERLKINTLFEINPSNSTNILLQERKEIEQDSSFISGKVKIVDGQDTISQPGINILIEGTEEGTTSDIDGNYYLSVPSEIYNQDSISVIFNFIGYSTKKVIIDNKTQKLNVVLSPDDQQLTEFYIYARPPLHKRIWYWITKPFSK